MTKEIEQGAMDPSHEDGYMPPHLAMMPPRPHGNRTGVDSTQLANIASEMGALTLERSAASQIMHVLQANAVKTSLETMPEILRVIERAIGARVNLIMQRVLGLQRVQMPTYAPGWRGALGFQQQLPVGAVMPEYVSLDQVKNILTQAQTEPVHTPGR